MDLQDQWVLRLKVNEKKIKKIQRILKKIQNFKSTNLKEILELIKKNSTLSLMSQLMFLTYWS